MMGARVISTGLLVGAGLWLVGAASASIGIAENASAPALKVDSRGDAQVSWTEAGARKTMLVPPTGRYLPGGTVSGADVSKPAPDVKLPLAVVVRRTPDGRLWALQSWRVQPGGPVELRLSRWKGKPTEIEAQASGGRLTGSVTFAGKGVFGTSPTTAGTEIRHYAFVDCSGCPGTSGWKRLLGLRLEGPGGTFALALSGQRLGKSYRVTVAGPNRGTTYAPDASVVLQASG
jgi:hypothetical protein